MSGALEKNMRAVGDIAGDQAAGRLIQNARIGVWSMGRPPASARLTAEALGDLLGRFWRSIDAEGDASGELAAAALSAADACGADTDVRRRWDPPYDFAIGVGEAAPPGSAPDAVAVGAAGWRAAAGSPAGACEDDNPVGPLAAAALASAEALKSVFGVDEARYGADRIPSAYEWDAWHGPPAAAGPPAAPMGPEPLDIGEVHVFGVGAVTHALLWLLRRWPGGVAGTLHLVDPDRYDEGNAHRYMGLARDGIGRPKASAVAGAMRRECPGLDAVPHDTDMNDYFTKKNPDCMVRTAVCGLDSKEGRRQLGLKLPLAIVNMWTSGFHAGASTFSFAGGGGPCIHCAYPEPAGGVPDEASVIHNELGLLPHRLRELLGSGRSIDVDDAQTIATATGAGAGDIPLKPIRSVRAEMCATGRFASLRGQNREDADVPLAPASAMAGVAGFAELVRTVRCGPDRVPGQFQTSVLKYPLPGSWTRRFRNLACRHCQDPVRKIALAKYA